MLTISLWDTSFLTIRIRDSYMSLYSIFLAVKPINADITVYTAGPRTKIREFLPKIIYCTPNALITKASLFTPKSSSKRRAALCLRSGSFFNFIFGVLWMKLMDFVKKPALPAALLMRARAKANKWKVWIERDELFLVGSSRDDGRSLTYWNGAARITSALSFLPIFHDR